MQIIVLGSHSDGEKMIVVGSHSNGEKMIVVGSHYDGEKMIEYGCGATSLAIDILKKLYETKQESPVIRVGFASPIDLQSDREKQAQKLERMARKSKRRRQK